MPQFLDTKIQGDRQELQVVLEQPEVSDLVAMLECQAFALEDILDQKKKL